LEFEKKKRKKQVSTDKIPEEKKLVSREHHVKLEFEQR